MFCMDDLVFQEYLLCLIGKVIYWKFTYDILKNSSDNGGKYRTGNVIMLPFIQYCLCLVKKVNNY